MAGGAAPEQREWRWARLGLCGLFAALSIAYGLVNPPFESPDERYHFDYIEAILRDGRLPVASAATGQSEYFQSPPYYLLGAGLTAWLPPTVSAHAAVEVNPYWGWRIGAVGVDNKSQFLHPPDWAERYPGLALRLRSLRLLATALALVVVWQAGDLAALWQPQTPAVAVIATAFAACLPGFVYTSSSVTNDTAAAALAALAVTAFSRRLLAPQPRWRLDVGAGVWLGLALAVKMSAVALVAAAGVAALADLVVSPRAQRGRRLRGWLLVFGLALFVALPVLGRNAVVYGDLTALRINDELWGRYDPARLVLDALVSEGPNVWTSFWGRFGYGQIPLPGAVYAAGLALVVIGLAGGLAFSLSRWRRMAPGARALLIFWGAVGGGYLAATLRYMTISLTGGQGRFLYPTLSILAVLVAAGWLHVAARLRWPVRPLSAVWAAAGAGLCAWALLAILRPAYVAPVEAVITDAAALAREDGIRLGDVALLRSVSMPTNRLGPGEDAHVTIEWMALRQTDQPLSMYVQWLDPDGAKLGARDTYPGLGRLDTRTWTPGAVVVDEVAVPILAEAGQYAPAEARLVVGLYDLETGARLAAQHWPEAVPVDGPVVLRAKLPPPPGQGPQAAAGRAVFGEAVQLESVELGTGARPGASLPLTLTWTALAPLACDCAVFVHLVPAGELQPAAQRDAAILNGRYPGTWWAAGERLTERYGLALPAALASGQYEVRLGLYNRADGQRLSVRSENAQDGPDSVLLGGVQIAP